MQPTDYQRYLPDAKEQQLYALRIAMERYLHSQVSHASQIPTEVFRALKAADTEERITRIVEATQRYLRARRELVDVLEDWNDTPTVYTEA